MLSLTMIMSTLLDWGLKELINVKVLKTVLRYLAKILALSYFFVSPVCVYT